MKRLNKEEKELLKKLTEARNILVNQRTLLFEMRQEFSKGIIDREIDFFSVTGPEEGEMSSIDICDDGARYLLEKMMYSLLCVEFHKVENT